MNLIDNLTSTVVNKKKMIGIINRINEKRRFKKELRQDILKLGVEILELLNFKYLNKKYVKNIATPQELPNSILDIIQSIEKRKEEVCIGDTSFFGMLDDICNELDISSYYFLLKILDNFEHRAGKMSVYYFKEWVDIEDTEPNSLTLSKEVLEDFDYIFRLTIDALYKNNDYLKYWIHKF